MLCNAIRELAEAYPDAISKSCLYTSGKCGPGSGCIVGQAFQKVYPHLKEMLEAIDDEGEMGVVSLLKTANLFGPSNSDWPWREDKLSLKRIKELVQQKKKDVSSLNKFDAHQIMWLINVQNKQDCGHTWSKAVKSADDKTI